MRGVSVSNPVSNSQNSNEKKEESKEKFCVLIIEEKSELRTFYMSALTKTGNYEVKNSATPREALELLEGDYEKINLIIFDWTMPEIPGSIFCHHFANICESR